MSVENQVQPGGTPISQESEERGEREPEPEPEPEPDKEDFYELREDEFTLESDESGEPVAAKSIPPLPQWAAASRALLDDWQGVLDEEDQSTIEVPPASALSPAAEPAASELSAREKLKLLVRQVQAREIYVQEVERALCGAIGRVRGQAFRIAELETELVAALAQSSAKPASGRVRQAAPKAKPKAKSKPADDLCEITGIGPRTAQQLKTLGVTTFDALANWTAADVIRIAARLSTSKGRIQREGWIKQARALRRQRASRKST